MARIGFVGVGNMGGPMALNLLKAGHSVKVFDLSADAVAACVEKGAEAAETAAEASKNVGIVVSMLPKGDHVRSVYLGDQGLLSAADPGTLSSIVRQLMWRRPEMLKRLLPRLA